MNEGTVKSYEQRFNRVLDYIDAHLNEPMSVEQLSKVANFSKFHFHRQFSQYTGTTVIAYIRMLRLKRASYRLVFHKHERVIDIALDAGFETQESFSRAFKHTYSQSPSQFRNGPKWMPWKEKFCIQPSVRREGMDVTITNFNETKVAKLTHRGAPELVNNSAMKFIEWRKQSGLSPVTLSQTFGIPYSDPETIDPEDFTFDICGSVVREIPEDNVQGVVNGVIPGGRCAIVRHLGSHDQIIVKVRLIFREWLPGSGEELRDFPIWFHYQNFFPEVAEHELITDIYLPLR